MGSNTIFMEYENKTEYKDERMIENSVIDAIKSGKAKMRSKWYFRLQSLLLTGAMVIILLMAIYLASFIVFVLHQDGAWFVPVFGLAGWYALFNALPWVLICLSCLFVIAVAYLVQRYQFGYQWPLAYSFLGIIFLIAGASFIFVQTSFSNAFFTSPIPQELPFLGQYYPGIGILAPSDIHRGAITATTTLGFIMVDFSGRTSTIIIASETDMVLSHIFAPGDVIVVFGDRNMSGTIEAVGIEKLTY